MLGRFSSVCEPEDLIVRAQASLVKNHKDGPPESYDPSLFYLRAIRYAYLNQLKTESGEVETVSIEVASKVAAPVEKAPDDKFAQDLKACFDKLPVSQKRAVLSGKEGELIADVLNLMDLPVLPAPGEKETQADWQTRYRGLQNLCKCLRKKGYGGKAFNPR